MESRFYLYVIKILFSVDISSFWSHSYLCICLLTPSFMQDQDVKVSELESENRKMKVELEEFRAEAAHLKNQQATIRRLEERNRQLEQQVIVLGCFLDCF